jgi:hypothetical protein
MKKYKIILLLLLFALFGLIMIIDPAPIITFTSFMTILFLILVVSDQ